MIGEFDILKYMHYILFKLTQSIKERIDLLVKISLLYNESLRGNI